VSKVIELTPHPGDERVEVDGVTPDRLATLGEEEIARLSVWRGRERLLLGDVFAVRGGRSAQLRVVGDASRVDGLGSGMTGGTLVVEGGAGRGVGVAMSGGTIEVRGDAGDEAGLAMAGGLILIQGRVGDRLGGASAGASKGMTGGEIIVVGSAGAEAGAAARRGLIAIGGDAGPYAARSMIAGTVIVCGRAGAGAATWSKRGSVVALGGVDIPPTFRYACTYRPPFLALVLTYLRERHKLPVEPQHVTGRYRRHSGDIGELAGGRGEILEWTAE
jgi:formylmethanofuran dehydrogenase subunit C